MTSKYKKIKGVEYNIEKRWEAGLPHHPETEALARKLRDLDVQFNHDSLDLKFGGDGDNGESLMYLLDVHFDEQDKQSNNITRK